MLSRCDAALLIGDPALASDFPGLLVRDLADDWSEMAGLPFVFAVWAVRAAALMEGLVPAFQESAAYALEHLEQIIPEEQVRTGLPAELIRSYLTENINFTLGERDLAGLRTFYEYAVELQLIPKHRPIKFA